VVFETRERIDRQTDRQTYRHGDHNSSHSTDGEVNIQNGLFYIMCTRKNKPPSLGLEGILFAMLYFIRGKLCPLRFVLGSYAQSSVADKENSAI